LDRLQHTQIDCLTIPDIQSTLIANALWGDGV
jgi:hypothetical protein